MKLNSKLVSAIVGCSLLFSVSAAYSFCLGCSNWVTSEKRLALYKCTCQKGDETVFTQLTPGNAIWYRAFNCNCGR